MKATSDFPLLAAAPFMMVAGSGDSQAVLQHSGAGNPIT
jgi:hypothetical protein